MCMQCQLQLTEQTTSDIKLDFRTLVSIFNFYFTNYFNVEFFQPHNVGPNQIVGNQKRGLVKSNYT